MSKPACVDCHFFVKQTRDDMGGRFTWDVTMAERERVRDNDFDWQRDYEALMCDFGVWDEGYRFSKARRYSLLVETDRRRKCFFWRYRPGILQPAAKVLQERESLEKTAARDRRLTIIGLFIAAVALLLNVVVDIAKELDWWPLR